MCDWCTGMLASWVFCLGASCDGVVAQWNNSAEWFSTHYDAWFLGFSAWVIFAMGLWHNGTTVLNGLQHIMMRYGIWGQQP